MRNYFCDVCGKGFTEEEKPKLLNIMGMAQSLAKSSPGYIIQHLKYRLISEMARDDICFSCQCKIADAMGQEARNIIHESRSKEKEDA